MPLEFPAWRSLMEVGPSDIGAGCSAAVPQSDIASLSSSIDRVHLRPSTISTGLCFRPNWLARHLSCFTPRRLSDEGLVLEYPTTPLGSEGGHGDRYSLASKGIHQTPPSPRGTWEMARSLTTPCYPSLVCPYQEWLGRPRRALPKRRIWV